MKIAILSPVAWRTPPVKYGPWEQVASNVAEGLVEKGFDVTLFATAQSITRGKLQSVVTNGYAENTEQDPKVVECLHISHLMEQADDFDIIHNHFDFLPLTFSKLIKTPMLTTIHGFSSAKIVEVYKKYNLHTYYASISNADRSRELDYLATVYNGIDPANFSFQQIPKDYVLFFGRIHPEKGTYEAIQIAKRAGRKLVIAGLIQDQGYFDEKVKPYLNETDVIYVGNAEPKERNVLLGEAYALLHPISFAEPFGLSVAEAMMCGTPVIAFNLGSMPELILEGKTGFLVNSIDEAVEALANFQSLKRSDCRNHALLNFSKASMAEDYLEVYRKILD